MRRILVILLLISFTTFSMTTKEQILSNTLGFEGDKVYKNSKRGIELVTLKEFNKKYGKNYKLKELTHNQALEIADKLYWDSRLDYIHPEIAASIFDYTFNSNPNKAYMRIHTLFGLKPKPYMSLELIGKINSTYKDIAIKKICDSRIVYLKSLKGWNRYGKGWTKRINDLRKFKIK